MTGLNRKYLSESLRPGRKNKLCVFISHQKKDSSVCRKIADYLMSTGLDVYFDEYDRDLKIAVQSDNPKKVVNAIKTGIKNSTHMLCVISPNTLYSKWVPFEVGYGYDITQVSVLTLKGIKNSDLPQYIRAVPIIRDINDVNQFLKTNKHKFVLESRNFLEYNSVNHPLATVMDRMLTK